MQSPLLFLLLLSMIGIGKYRHKATLLNEVAPDARAWYRSRLIREIAHAITIIREIAHAITIIVFVVVVNDRNR